MIPSVENCFAIMDRYEMLEHIKTHSIMVTRIAQLIGKGVLAAGADVSLEKTIAAALLHDIGKTAALQTDQDHTAVGKRICLQCRFDEIADIVEEHVRLREFAPAGVCSEKEIVFYADKRVNHDRIVSLEERLQYIEERYGRNEEKIRLAIRRNFQLCKQVEGKIFEQLTFDPESLPELALQEEVGIS
jgi:putative nucleotidyltransferase with HDIG domain